MLSAIAARKAAQAAQPLPEATSDTAPLQNITQSASPPSSESEPDWEPSPVAPRKRKALESDTPRKKRQKKKNRVTIADVGRHRYFEAQQPIPGFDDENNSATPVSASSRSYSPSQPIPDIEVGNDEEMDSGLASDIPRVNRGFSPSRPVPDSSEEEQTQNNQTESNELGNTISAAETQRPHTTFMPRLDSNTFQLSSADLESLQLPSDGASNTVLLLLAPGMSLSFVGTASIILLRGAITVLGTPITPSRHVYRVFSPRSCPFVSLESLDARSTDGGVVSFHQGFKDGDLPPQVQNQLRASDSIVIIQELQTAVEGLGNICRTFCGVFELGLDLKRGEADEIIGLNGFHLFNPHTSHHPQLQPFYLPESWQKALDAAIMPFPTHDGGSLSFSFVGLVRGPKKCGKSTFARTLLNRLTMRYRHVAFLECDIGQSEFTPGGMVSLHVISKPVFGPPFTHPRLPYRAHYVGHVTPRYNPAHYLSCIQSLVQTYRMDVQYAYQDTIPGDLSPTGEGIGADGRIDGLVPLIINTQGWMKGLGGDLLRKIEEIVGPTHLYDLDGQNFFPQQRMQTTNTLMHALQPIPTSSLAAYYTAADHRSLAILSYFHCRFPSEPAVPEVLQWVTDIPLCASPPWYVDCREAIDQIVLVGAGYEDVVPQELGNAINCGLVALVCDEGPTSMFDVECRVDSPFRYKQGAAMPDPNTSHCIGLALIRGVDVPTQALHLLTPLPRAALAQCRVLVKGELELPVWGMLDFRGGHDAVVGVPWEKVPYLQMTGQGSGVGAIGAGAGRRRVRRNLMRRAQM